MLPASRNTTYAALSQVKSADLDALQDFMIALHRDRLNLEPLDIERFTGSVIDQGKLAGLAAMPAAVTNQPGQLLGVHAAGNDIITSPDAISWLATADIGDFNGIQHHRAVFWSAVFGKFFIASQSGSTDEILSAADPLGVWTATSDPQIGGDDRGGMAESPDILIFPGTTEISGTDDGTTWSHHENPGTGQTMRAAAWSPSLALFVVVGDAASAASAPDGTTWTDRTATVAVSLAGTNFNDVVWDPINACFLASGDNGKIAKSIDGINWTDAGIDADVVQDIAGLEVDPVAGLVFGTTGLDFLIFSYDGGAHWWMVDRPSFMQPGTAMPAFTVQGRPIAFGQDAVTTNAAIALGRFGRPLAILAP